MLGACFDTPRLRRWIRRLRQRERHGEEQTRRQHPRRYPRWVFDLFHFSNLFLSPAESTWALGENECIGRTFLLC
jgi:hypothetical protein